MLNLTYLCQACHSTIHANVEESYLAGWLVSAKFHGAEVARLYEVTG